MSNQAIVYAVHNFEAENEDEINFSIGEAITVLEKDEKYLDGWWQVHTYTYLNKFLFRRNVYINYFFFFREET